MEPSKTLEKITKDVEVMWGDMALHIIDKRLRDLGINKEKLSYGEIEKIIDVLCDKTFQSTLGPDGCKKRKQLYLKWLREASPNFV